MSKELFKKLGFSEDLEEDKFVEEFNKTYIKREDVIKDEQLGDKIVGKRIGALQTQILKHANKDHSFALGADKKPRPIEEVVADIFKGISDDRKEIEDRANLTAEERVKQAEEKAQGFLKERDNYKTKLGEITGEYEKVKTQSAQDLDNVLLQYRETEVISKIPFIDNLTDLQRKGFHAEINDNYIRQFDETKSNILVKDKSGNLIPSKKKAGAFADLEEVLTMIADTGGILKKNNGKPINQNIKTETREPINGVPQRKKSIADYVKQS